MTYVIAQPCVDLKDKACIEECPVDCIYEGERSLYIHPDECVDCGACEPVCPVEAIYYEDDVPDQWKDYYKANVEFFDDLGSPGGAAKLGVIPKDHPLIAALAAAGARALSATLSRLDGGCRGCGSPCPTSPGTGSRRPRHAPARTPAASSTSRSARRSTRRRRSSATRCARRPTRPATRRPTAPRPCARRSPRWFARRRGVPGVDPDGVLPTVGSKELVAWLPTLLGLGPGDLVVHPRGRLPDLRRRRAARRRDPGAGRRHRPARPRSAGRGSCGSTRRRNPTGRVLRRRAPGQGRRVGPRARRRRGQRRVLRRAAAGTATRRCRASSTRAVCGGSHDGAARRLLAVQAVQPRRLPAGVRRGRPGAGRAACSRSASTPGMIVPWPGAGGDAAALYDDAHVAEQRERYRRAGATTAPAGAARRRLPVDHSEAGLYLWASRGRAVLGDRRAAAPTRGCSWRRASSTAPPAPGTCGWR